MYNNSGNCQPCESTCKNCLGPLQTQCNECPIDRFRSQSAAPFTCVLVCQAQTYPDTIEKLCKPCDATCSSCQGPLANECTDCVIGLKRTSLALTFNCIPSCLVGTFEENNICKVCDATCATCDGPTASDCLTCQPHLVPVGAGPNHTCENSCGDEKFYNGSSCQNCDTSCFNCSGGLASNCT